MQILLAHNYYVFGGGEDTVFAAEKALLCQHGHEVREYVEDNRRITGMPRLAVAPNLFGPGPPSITSNGFCATGHGT
jgi:hypothetical protein